MKKEKTEWKLVFSTQDRFHAEMVRATLSEAGIDAIVLDKKESMYNLFGESEVYVSRSDILWAIKIIEDEVRLD
jgi:Putative prokaryotic signal transducing protein